MAENGHDAWRLATTEMKPALSLAMALEHAPMGLLMLYDETRGCLRPVLAEGMENRYCLRVGAQAPGVGPFGKAFKERRRVTVDNLQTVSTDGLSAVARELGARCVEVIPLRGNDGTPVGALGVFFRRTRLPTERLDTMLELCGRLFGSVVENARLRCEAEVTRDRAEERNRKRAQFLGRLSHELRTPLQSVTGYLDLLRLDTLDPLTERQRTFLGRVEKSEHILIKAIEDLILLAQVEGGSLSYSISRTSASSAMETAEMVVAPLAAAGQLRLTRQTCDETVAVFADPDKLTHILINLIANAVKFTPPGGSVRIECIEDGKVVRFRIADSGPGIDPARLKEIFHPFVQLGPRQQRQKGWGLGLAISQDYAKAMGGDIEVTSKVGEGSVFTLSLPRA